MHKGHQAEARLCLGVYRCTSCGHLVRPRTSKTTRDKQRSEACPNGRCRVEGSLQPLECDAVAYHYKLERNGEQVQVWEQVGSHRHPRPPGGRVSLAEENAVDEQVKRRPDASAHQLRTGSGLPGSVPLVDINPSLSNPRAARYVVNKSMSRLGLQPSATAKGGLALLHDLGALPGKLGGRFIVESSFSGPTYFSIQTPFMETIIEESVEDWIAQDMSGPDAGRHGFVTDGDQSFFRQGTLLTTCAFSTTLNKWVPVLYTWIDGLDTEHHRPHFRRLNQSIVQCAGVDFHEKLLTAVRVEVSVWKAVVY